MMTQDIADALYNAGKLSDEDYAKVSRQNQPPTPEEQSAAIAAQNSPTPNAPPAQSLAQAVQDDRMQPPPPPEENKTQALLDASNASYDQATAPAATAVPVQMPLDGMPASSGVPQFGMGMMPTSESTSTISGVKFTPQEKAANDAASKRILAAQTSLNQAQAGQAAESAKTDKSLAAAAQSREADETQQRASEQARIDTQLQNVQSAMDDFRNTKIDPNHYWSDKSTGNKILAAFAVGLGGFAAGQNGGPNQAASIIDKAVQRDVDAQVMNANMKSKNVEFADHAYQNLRQSIGDDRTSRQALYSLKMENVMADLKSRIGTLKTAEQQAQGEKTLGLLQQAKAQNDMNMTASEQGKTQSTSSSSMGLGVSQVDANGNPVLGPDGKPVLRPYVPTMNIGGGQVPYNKELAERITNDPISGKAILTRKAKDADDLTKEAAVYGTYRQGLNKLIDLRDKYGAGTLPLSEARAQMNTIATHLILTGTSTEGVTRLNPGEQNLLTEIVGNPAAVGQVDAKLKQFRDLQDEKMRMAYKTRGIEWSPTPTNDLLSQLGARPLLAGR